MRGVRLTHTMVGLGTSVSRSTTPSPSLKKSRS